MVECLQASRQFHCRATRRAQLLAPVRPWVGAERLEPRLLLSAAQLPYPGAEPSALKHRSEFSEPMHGYSSVPDLGSLAVAPPIAIEFERVNPLGGLMFVSANVGQIERADDHADFRFFAEGGQTISAVLRPLVSDATGQLSLLGNGAVVRSPAPGAAAIFPTASIGSDGIYRLRVGMDMATSFTLDVFRNVSLEAQIGDSGEDNALAIDDSFTGGRLGVVGHSEPQVVGADAIVWGVQPQTGQILKIEPLTGRILDRFAAPDFLGSDHTEIGLTIADDGASLLYINSDFDPHVLYRLDPDTGAMLSTETTGGFTTDGLGYAAGPSPRVTIYNQDFESGLRSTETVFGEFAINDTNTPLNNGTQMMGHPSNYDNNEYSYYELTVDLAGLSNAQLQFDYVAFTEQFFDRINVQAGVGSLSPPGDLITPVSGLPYQDYGDVQRPELGLVAYDSGKDLDTATAIFDLSSFDGRVATIRIQFGSDGSITFPGMNIDNVVVTGEGNASALIFFGESGVALHRQDGLSGPLTAAWATGEPIGALGGDGTGRQFGTFRDGFIHEYDPFTDTDSYISTLPAPSGDIEGMAFDGSNLYVSTSSGDLYTLDPDTGDVLIMVPVSGGALYGLGATVAAPPAPASSGLVYVASRGADRTGGQIEVYDEQGNLLRTIEDSIFDTSTMSDVEIGPNGNVFVSLDLGGDGINGGLVEFTPEGSFVRMISLPDDTGLRDLLYPLGFEVLSDGTFLVPKPNAGVIQHLDASGVLLGQQEVSDSRPADVAVTGDVLVWADIDFGGEGFLNTTRDEFGWIALGDENVSELFDPNYDFMGNRRPGHTPVDPQESSDNSLFVTNSGDDTLRKFGVTGNLQFLVPTVGDPIGLAVVSGEVLRPLPFELDSPSARLVSFNGPGGAAGEKTRAESSWWSVLEPRNSIAAADSELTADHPVVPDAISPETVTSLASASDSGATAADSPVAWQSGAQIYVQDDGSSENAIGLTDGGDIMWMNAFTARGGFETINSIALTWGFSGAGGTSIPAGSSATVLLYEDPNDDGDPTDAILLISSDTEVTDPDTDLFTTVPITPTSVSGTFFVGALLRNQLADQFPASLDETTSAGRSWVVSHDTPGEFDIGDLSNNDQPPVTMVAVDFPGNWLLRADSQQEGNRIIVPDVDAYTLDLAGRAGQYIDVILAGRNADLSAESLEMLDPDGTTVLAKGRRGRLGVDATNYDLAILDLLVPANGVYTIRVSSQVQGDYTILVAAGGFDTEPNDDLGPEMPEPRSLNSGTSVLGFLSAIEPLESMVVDGGFEFGPFGGAWNEFSTRFNTPICSQLCGDGGGTGPHMGSFWAWFGRGDNFELGSLDQDVVFPTGAATLTFFLEIPVASGTGSDFLDVSIDGDVVFSVSDLDADTYPTYTKVTVDVGAFADGDTHNIRFDSVIFGPDVTIFFVDDVALFPGSLLSRKGVEIRNKSASSKDVTRTTHVEPIPGRLIVRYADDLDKASRVDRMSSYGAKVVGNLPLINAVLVELQDPQSDVHQVAAQWIADPSVLYAEPDYGAQVFQTFPNDSDFSSLWGLHNTGQTGGTPDADIDAPEAWDFFTGSTSVVVASIDTGVDYNHPDLADHMWRNPGEIPGDGIDNDGNGYVDDIHGIDAVNDDSDPFDDNFHGTHTTGIFGAIGNNEIGVTGVNWDVQIMALKFLDDEGTGSFSDAIELIDYMTMMKTRAVDPVNIVVSNNSWGSTGFSNALRDAIEASIDAGILFVAAAGNGGDDGVGDDNDIKPIFPASYDLEGVIAVAATDHRDRKARFSNFGAASVDLGAPGVAVHSTAPDDVFFEFKGTSMAAPHVTGAVALLRAAHPDTSLSEVKSAILNGVDPIPALEDITVSGGRLNLANAVSLMGQIGPKVLRVSPSVGQVDDLEITEITIEFSEPITSSSALDPNNYQLIEAGPNRQFDDGVGDDVLISLTPSFDGTVTVTLTIDPDFAPLALGSYRLRIEGDSSVEDLGGNPLNSVTGSGGGSDQLHEFDVIFELETGGDLYTLNLAANQSVTVRTVTPFDNLATTPLNTLDPRLTILDPAGRPITADDNSSDGKNARITFDAPASGTYTVQVLALTGIGEYMLDLLIVPLFLPGDADGDGDVDFTDFSVITANFTGTITPSDTGDKTREQGDFDGDGDVDFADFILFASNFTGSMDAAVPGATTTKRGSTITDFAGLESREPDLRRSVSLDIENEEDGLVSLMATARPLNRLDSPPSPVAHGPLGEDLGAHVVRYPLARDVHPRNPAFAPRSFASRITSTLVFTTVSWRPTNALTSLLLDDADDEQVQLIG